MPSEAARVPHEWTTGTALAYLLELIETHETQRLEMAQATDRRYEQRFAAIQEMDKEWRTNHVHEQEKTLVAMREAMAATLSATKEAVNKQEAATEKRFEGVNEFRATLDQQQRTLIPRSEVDVTVKGLEGRLADVTKLLDSLDAKFMTLQAERNGVKGGWGYAVGLIGFLMALYTFTQATHATVTPAAASAPQIIYVPSPPGTLLPTTPANPVPR